MEGVGAGLLPTVIQNVVGNQMLKKLREAPAFGFPYGVFPGYFEWDCLENLGENVRLKRWLIFRPAQTDGTEQVAIDSHFIDIRFFQKGLA